jgi:predicted Zn-dependent protease
MSLESLFRAGDIEAARRAVDERLAKNAGDTTALIGRARLLALDRDLNASLDLLNRVLQDHPNHAAAKTYKAVVLDLQGQHKSAEVLLRNSLKLEPGYGPTHYNLARHLVRAGRLDEALAELDAAAKIEPENPTYTLRIAELLLEQGKDSPAAEVLTALVSMFPDFADGWLCVGRAYLRHGDPKNAMRALASGLSHCPSNLPLALMAFQTAAILGDVAFCERAVQVVMQLAGTFGQLLGTIVAILRAPDAAESARVAGAVNQAMAPVVADFMQQIVDAAPAKRAAVLRPVLDGLRARTAPPATGKKAPAPKPISTRPAVSMGPSTLKVGQQTRPGGPPKKK